MKTLDPDGFTFVKLEVYHCSIVPDNSLVPRGRACMLNKASLSHLLILSVLRPNFLPLFDVMMDHSHMIFVYSMCKSIKINFVEFMQCVPAVYTRHVCCVYVYNVHVLVWGSIA